MLENRRCPVPVGVGPYPFKTVFELLFTNKRNYFVKNNPELYKQTRKTLDAFFKDDLKDDVKNKRLCSYSLDIWIFSVLGVSTAAIILFNLSLFNTLLFGFIIAVPSFYLFLAWNNTTYRRILGKKYDNDIKRVVQELIDYGIVFIRENDLDLNQFPLKLRHDDYEGLNYKKKGKNNYVGFFEK